MSDLPRNGDCSSPLAEVKKASLQRSRKIGSNRIKTSELGQKRIIAVQIAVITRCSRHVRNAATGCVDL
jgi:hypothetical protein